MHLHPLHTTTLDPAERGRVIASTYGPFIMRNVYDYLEHFASLKISSSTVRSIAENSHKALLAWDQSLAVELEAQAKELDIELWQLGALNARTEVLAAAPPSKEGECSTAVFVPRQGAPATFQTWDWHPHLAFDGLLHELKSGTGRSVKLFTEFGINGKIGVNSSGLGVHFNILAHANDNASGGVPVHSIARSVLERAGSIDEAIALTENIVVSASTVLTLVQGEQQPQAASIEFSPSGRRVVNRTTNGWALHTNHFLDGDLFAGDVMPADSTTAERYDYLAQRTPGHEPGSAKEIADLLASSGAEAPVLCMAPEAGKPATEQWETLLSIGLDTEKFALHYFNGNPDAAARTGLKTF
ncbi:hypothetical protein AUR04nite_05250 [Glutamicibacter uratoxydans]|uniref:Peptidase C45 hydrolase domain-containing protein n=1 Tax=Glutamicibacter uratoxydans TaxID=43667 RepID=A0A4Y4DK91_GLUUR|nr:C45 family peptidase [Glutamicibacter uratoxydans]GED04993.1 hypothetical protein AUR04nite_05250 [Glutamicibacter uratoxydans]